jgi:hypothetical protein
MFAKGGRSTVVYLSLIMTQARMITTDAEIDAAIERAKLLDGEPPAKTAVYIPSLKVLMVGLTNGRRLALPIEDLQGGK